MGNVIRKKQEIDLLICSLEHKEEYVVL